MTKSKHDACVSPIPECESESSVSPIFLTKPGSKILTAGDLFTLECDVIGTPKPVVSWFKEGNKLSHSDRVLESYDGRVACVKIPKCTQNDSGKYECVAQNEAGNASTDALVVVKGNYYY